MVSGGPGGTQLNITGLRLYCKVRFNTTLVKVTAESHVLTQFTFLLKVHFPECTQQKQKASYLQTQYAPHPQVYTIKKSHCYSSW